MNLLKIPVGVIHKWRHTKKRTLDPPSFCLKILSFLRNCHTVSDPHLPKNWTSFINNSIFSFLIAITNQEFFENLYQKFLIQPNSSCYLLQKNKEIFSTWAKNSKSFQTPKWFCITEWNWHIFHSILKREISLNIVKNIFSLNRNFVEWKIPRKTQTQIINKLPQKYSDLNRNKVKRYSEHE